MQLTGFKKVLNYIKRVKEEWKFKKSLSREEVIESVFCLLVLSRNLSS